MRGDLRELHNEELCNLYSSSSIIRMIKSRRMICVGHVAQIGKMNTYRLLVGKRPIGRQDKTRRWILEMGWGVTDWIGLAQDKAKFRALVNALLNLQLSRNV
jgi:hypothetical protein